MPHLSPTTLTTDEQRQILRATAGNVRDHTIISLALGTGLRLAEIVGLDVGDEFAPDVAPRTRVRVRAMRPRATTDPATPSVPSSTGRSRSTSRLLLGGSRSRDLRMPVCRRACLRHGRIAPPWRWTDGAREPRNPEMPAAGDCFGPL